MVTATYLGHEAQTTVHVASAATAPGPTVTVRPAFAELAVGEELALTVQVLDAGGVAVSDPEVDWVSSDSTVVRVPGGSGVRAGCW